ncbi:MAG: Proton-translocating NADH-quinone oxidoreductase, chain L [Parcubacteria group bacterium GW2011_GWA2_47_10]|nr:MAG: Proton-translocating NADH-quinone oxidoreductase, chain L [Parcubacteria group bacterium GW2011_GWA2_47_10]
MTLIALSIAAYFIGFLLILLVLPRMKTLPGWIAAVSATVSLGSIAYARMASLPTEMVFYRTSIGGISASFGFIADNLSLVGAGLVSFVALLVFLYAQDYMSEDDSQKRFFAEMCLFAGSMTGILLSVSLLQMFVFWELVGLSSFLLIGFWYDRPEAASAAQKVFTLIVIGDALLLAGILLLGSAAHSWDFAAVNLLTLATPEAVLGVFLILCGAFVKSAQAPFFFWLPWAMEGPTPVSALLHSATMVKAGAFLILRLFPLVVFMGFKPLLLAVALLTSIIAGVSALAERDVKRILAYSTVSQLGFIMLAIGLGDPHAGIFHLVTDAFYKALLFLGAGVIIHLGGSRDIFSLSRFSFKKNAAVLILTAVGVLGISGLPPFGAFFSKDAILDAAFKQSALVYWLAVFAAFLTNAYVLRWCFLIFRGISFSETPEAAPEHEKNIFGWRTKFAMALLSLGVLSFGFTGMRFFSEFFYEHEPELNPMIVTTTLLLFAAAFVSQYFVYVRIKSAPEVLGRVLGGLPYAVARSGFGFSRLAELFASFGLMIGRILSIIDTRMIDGALNLAASLGQALSRVAAFIDVHIIDRILNGGVAGFIKACLDAELFDQETIDGLVRGVARAFRSLADLCRPMVNGIVIRYIIAFSFGTLGLVIVLHLVT